MNKEEKQVTKNNVIMIHVKRTTQTITNHIKYVTENGMINQLAIGPA